MHRAHPKGGAVVDARTRRERAAAARQSELDAERAAEAVFTPHIPRGPSAALAQTPHPASDRRNHR